MSEKNKWLIESKDIMTFDLKIIEDKEDGKKFKFDNKTITLGNDELYSSLDENIIGNDLTQDKHFSFDIKLEEEKKIFDTTLNPGDYTFAFKVTKLQKHDSKEQLDVNKIKDTHNDKKRIKELEEDRENLLSKIQKLESEKQLSEQIFKAKAEEMAKNAATKVEILKEEIKNKAKEDVDYKTKYAIQKLVEDLLSPLNNLYVAVETGAKSNDAAVSAYVKGFQMLISQILNTLEAHGVYAIDPKEGDLFNPEFHHAQEVLEDVTFKKDQIIKVISRGYKLQDRVLKPAIVIVAK